MPHVSSLPGPPPTRTRPNKDHSNYSPDMIDLPEDSRDERPLRSSMYCTCRYNQENMQRYWE